MLALQASSIGCFLHPLIQGAVGGGVGSGAAL